MTRFILSILYPILLLTGGCRNVPGELEIALEKSDINRKELLVVLKHYSQTPTDSLKLKAAEYLIKNMLYEFSYEEKERDLYSQEATEILFSRKSPEHITSEMNELNIKHKDKFKKTSDLQTITSDFLIENIEKSFRIWQEKPWCKELSFEEFCEYILPYKIVHSQPIENWKGIFEEKLQIDMELFDHCTPYQGSPYHACVMINKSLRKMVNKVPWNTGWFPLMRVEELIRTNPKTCDGDAYVTAIVMRSEGVPVSIDFTPIWPVRESGHSWNNLLMKSGMRFPFLGMEYDINRRDKPEEKLSKIYRHSPSINRELAEIIESGTYKPYPFTHPYLKDVTTEYTKTTDISFPLRRYSENNISYAWLAGFSIKGWQPVAWGVRKNREIHFKDVGKESLYLPVHFQGDTLKALDYPFVIARDCAIKKFIPDFTTGKDRKIYRKYPTNLRTYIAGKNIIGTQLEASGDPEFKESNIIYEIEHWKHSGAIHIHDSVSAYRCWRFLSKTRDCCLAEIRFYRKDDKEIRGEILGIDEPDNDYPISAAFDNDPLTYFRAMEPGTSWVGMDFGAPVHLSKIVYIPRSDDNNIRRGDIYELFYWYQGLWTSLGKQKAKDIFLEYKNLPDNALFWLRNLSRGVEERPFSFEKDKQIWW